MKAKKKPQSTPGQRLWLSLYRADHYDRTSNSINVPQKSSKLSPELATQRWLKGMSRHLKSRFGQELRNLRNTLNLTQHQLAEIAELSSTAVAMIERGERAPNLDTAARLCWALDVAAGMSETSS